MRATEYYRRVDAGALAAYARELEIQVEELKAELAQRRVLEGWQLRRAQQLAFQAEVSRILGQPGTLGDALQQCAAAVVTYFESAFARIWLLNEPEGVLELRASAGLYTHLDGAHSRVPLGTLMVGRIAAEAQPHLTNDVSNDPRVIDKEWAAREGMVAFAGYPLIAQGRVVGVMALFARHRLHDDLIEALASVTDVIAERIERSRAEALLEGRAKELARSNQDLELFAYASSHDLQEPLRQVVSYLQLLERRHAEKLDGEAREFLDFAVEGGRRMQRLIADLLAYSRVGRQDSPLSLVDTGAVVDEALAGLRRAIAEQGATVTRDELPALDGNRALLVQLFQNLVANGIKFHGGEPPVVHVSAERANGGVWRFAVRDNGIGIDPIYWERIFVMFRRLHRRQEYPGTGIGLAMCKKIVEFHGGSIWVESELGKGSTFYFTLAESKASDE
jgi:signal transduction histidine kinase